MVDFRYQGAPPPVGDSGDVTSVTAGDATVTIGGTGANPTVKVTAGQFDAAGAAATAQTAAQAYADTGDAARILKSTRQLKTANYTAVIGDLVAADTTGGTFTVTIPAASVGKGRVLVKWVAGAVAPTIALSGSDHFNTTSGATSATPALLNQGYQFESDGTSVWTVTADDLPLSQLDLRYANLASPALTGTPTAPTPSALDNSTKLATTAYADAATGVEKTRALAAEALLAPLASPGLTGNPTAPTQAASDNSTKIATTAYADTAKSKVTIMTSSGNFVKDPRSVTTRVDLVGPGGSGSGGYRSAAGAVAPGGAGGAGGGVSSAIFQSSDLASPVAVVVGTGGAGGAGATSDNSAGAAGANASGSTTFGTTTDNYYLAASRGQQGLAPTSSAGGAGQAGGVALWQGGTGAAGSAGVSAGTAGSTAQACASGGGGGGNTTGNTFTAGGAGGTASTMAGFTAPAGGATDGAAGTAGGTRTNRGIGGNGGAGGASSVLTTGGKGGDGGFPGGGAGGGGGSRNGSAGGAGGKGGDGVAIMTETF